MPASHESTANCVAATVTEPRGPPPLVATLAATARAAPAKYAASTAASGMVCAERQSAAAAEAEAEAGEGEEDMEKRFESDVTAGTPAMARAEHDTDTENENKFCTLLISANLQQI